MKPDYGATLEEVKKCLKPGGMLIVIEVDADQVAEDQKGFVPMGTEDNPDGSWLRRVTYGEHSICRNSSLNTLSLTEVRSCGRFMNGDTYLREAILDEGLWHHESLDPATCGSGSIYLPVGPWPQCEHPTPDSILCNDD